MKHVSRKRFIAAVCAATLALGLPLNAGSGPRAKSTPTTFSGRATVVDASVLGFNPIVLSDTGDLPSGGGALEASLLSFSQPGLLSVEVLHASTIGQGDRSRSEASVANVGLTVAGNNISAGFLMARAEARCANGQAVLSGSSEVVNLVVNGQSVSVSGQPNQTIALPLGGSIIINEQTSSASGNTGEITVNALHVIVPGVADVIISSAHADIACATAGGCVGDFVTGGGWITGTPSGARGHFAVAGGLKKHGLWGHLVYQDHGNGMKVHGTGVTGYFVVDATTRRITGTCEINGQGGYTYDVTVADNGEPGRNDTFTLSLSNGYSAAGGLDGGNIQLHVCK